MRSSVDLHVHLLARGITHEFFHLEHRVRAPEDALSSLGITPDQFALGRVLLNPAGSATLAVVPAGTELDLAAVAEAVGVSSLRPARPLVSARLTGFPAEWIPPVSVDERIVEVVDPTLIAHDVIYGAGGEPGLLVGVRTADLVAHGALVAPVALPVGSMR